MGDPKAVVENTGDPRAVVESTGDPRVVVGGHYVLTGTGRPPQK